MAEGLFTLPIRSRCALSGRGDKNRGEREVREAEIEKTKTSSERKQEGQTDEKHHMGNRGKRKHDTVKRKLWKGFGFFHCSKLLSLPFPYFQGETLALLMSSHS